MKQFKFAFLVVSILLFSVGCQNKIDKVVFTKIVDDVNKQCPMEVDMATTLENCEYISGKTVQYNYTITIDIQEDNIESYRESMGKRTLYQTSVTMNEESSKAWKALKPTIIHSYKNKAGKLLFEQEITPEMYDTVVPLEMNTDELFKFLEQSAEIIRKSGIHEVEKDVFLVSTNAVFPNILAYDYILQNVYAENVDTIAFQKALIPISADVIKKDKQDQMLKDLNVCFRFIYYDVDEAYICTLDITPDMYK